MKKTYYKRIKTLNYSDLIQELRKIHFEHYVETINIKHQINGSYICVVQCSELK